MIIAIGVYCNPKDPSGPERHKRRLTQRPTTTGGSPIPKLTTLINKLRPGKTLVARKKPTGTPIKTLIKVAVPDTRRVNNVIFSTCGSPQTLANPFNNSSKEQPHFNMFKEA